MTPILKYKNPLLHHVLPNFTLQYIEQLHIQIAFLHNLAMDPYTATREQFTTHLTSRPLPPSASEEWKNVVEPSTLLLDKLAHHPAMATNLQQTYMTTANSKNKVYFIWDFIGRTLIRNAQFSDISLAWLTACYDQGLPLYGRSLPRKPL